MYWDSVKSEWEKEKQQILSVLTESSDELLDISLPIAEVFFSLTNLLHTCSFKSYFKNRSPQGECFLYHQKVF